MLHEGTEVWLIAGDSYGSDNDGDDNDYGDNADNDGGDKCQ